MDNALKYIIKWWGSIILIMILSINGIQAQVITQNIIIQEKNIILGIDDKHKEQNLNFLKNKAILIDKDTDLYIPNSVKEIEMIGKVYQEPNFAKEIEGHYTLNYVLFFAQFTIITAVIFLR